MFAIRPRAVRPALGQPFEVARAQAASSRKIAITMPPNIAGMTVTPNGAVPGMTSVRSSMPSSTSAIMKIP